jgi:hypothetical protein
MIHNDGHRKQHEARLSRHRVVHIHVMKKKRRSAHAEGADDSEDYIASEGVKLQRDRPHEEMHHQMQYC